MALEHGVLTAELDRPVEVVSGGNDELDLRAFSEVVQVGEQVGLGFTGIGALDVEDDVDTLRNPGDVQASRGLQEDGFPTVQKGLHEGQRLPLSERLPARDFDQVDTMRAGLLSHVLNGSVLTAGKGELGVAPGASKIAAGQAHENTGFTRPGTLPLNGSVNLDDSQPLVNGNVC